MGPDGRDIRNGLDRLVAGMTGLKHDGRFHEPNLDGTAGDYISFDSWEWPQGVGLYGLIKLWLFTGRDDLRQLVEDWYQERIEAGLPQLNVNTTAPMLGLSVLWAKTRDPRWQPLLDDWANRVMSEHGPHAGRRLRASRLRQGQRQRTLGRHALHGRPVPGVLRSGERPARTGR